MCTNNINTQRDLSLSNTLRILTLWWRISFPLSWTLGLWITIFRKDKQIWRDQGDSYTLSMHQTQSCRLPEEYFSFYEIWFEELYNLKTFSHAIFDPIQEIQWQMYGVANYAAPKSEIQSRNKTKPNQTNISKKRSFSSLCIYIPKSESTSIWKLNRDFAVKWVACHTVIVKIIMCLNSCKLAALNLFLWV